MTELEFSNHALAEALEKLIEFVERFRENVDWYGIDGYYKQCYKKDIKELEGRVDFSRKVLEASKQVVKNER